MKGYRAFCLGVILMAGVECGCSERKTDQVCMNDARLMPESWRPPSQTRIKRNPAPWSVAEAKDAEYAVKTGLLEMTDFMARKPEAAIELSDNAIEAFLDASYGASNMPALRDEAREQARQVLIKVIEPYLARGAGAPANCEDFSQLLMFSVYAGQLMPMDERKQRLVELTNKAFRACGSLTAVLGYDYRARLAHPDTSVDDIWDVLMTSITLTGAEATAGLELPVEAKELTPSLWRYLKNYPLVGARAFPDGANNLKFYNAAYLATHIGYIPSGYGRYLIYVDDSPALYHFLRENFYAVLEMGELDLTSEFVDLFREYGCTEENDWQTRDGTRYLLQLFHTAGDRWMAHREPGETGDVTDYDAMHKPWTGMAGVRARVPEPVTPGSYGAVVRGWMGYPK